MTSDALKSLSRAAHSAAPDHWFDVLRQWVHRTARPEQPDMRLLHDLGIAGPATIARRNAPKLQTPHFFD